ncbi:hypothetical protein [Methanohalobium sp.]|uniref:hypothetical protein n=1 Tax=Methanohalobium sp. TaxID=2837493 RepID=UPI0025E46979|nr:hypothetical protein [Methanohalobium sp.]
MSEENFARKVNSALQEESISFDVTVDKPTILHKLGILKKKKTFRIDPPPLRMLARISEEIEKLQFADKKFEEIKDDANIFDVVREFMPTVKDNYEHVLRAIIIAATNKEPSKKMMKFFGDNMRPKEVYDISALLIQKFDLTFFLLSLACLKGVNVWGDSTRSSSSEEQSEQDTAEKKSSTESPG